MAALRTLAGKDGTSAAGVIFSSQLKTQLTRKAVAYSVASGIARLAQIGLTVMLWAANPGGALANYLDLRDSNPGNGSKKNNITKITEGINVPFFCWHKHIYLV
ncbi:hypothetical protein HYG86_01375 [Alkalicella caledoniensis]|uniref:Uncharacterized protein n=1 Tax=Alkalicella caledoniensis TaxID=2731377 RepID=A0A7G9W499_ALKCA|nr:hypothetical protein [Alkalicella caledoniensis]QNO13511.1 hypothetical protein HYG86_01375 [Alkalicella caledoniensis]